MEITLDLKLSLIYEMTKDNDFPVMEVQISVGSLSLRKG